MRGRSRSGNRRGARPATRPSSTNGQARSSATGTPGPPPRSPGWTWRRRTSAPSAWPFSAALTPRPRASGKSRWPAVPPLQGPTRSRAPRRGPETAGGRSPSWNEPASWATPTGKPPLPTPTSRAWRASRRSSSGWPRSENLRRPDRALTGSAHAVRCTPARGLDVAQRRLAPRPPHQLGTVGPLLRLPRLCRGGGLLRPLPLVLRGVGARALLRADVGGDDRIPPVLRPPLVQDVPGLPVPAGLLRRDLGPEGRPVVGGESPAPPSGVGPAGRSPLPAAGRFLVEPRGLDPLRPLLGDARGGDPRLRPLPGAPVPEPLVPPPSVSPGGGAVPDRRLPARGLGFFREHPAPLARHLHHQLAEPRLRLAALPDDRHQPEQLPPRADHLRRGLAQQPPLPSEHRQPGLVLVGAGPVLLHAEAALGPRAGLGPALPVPVGEVCVPQVQRGGAGGAAERAGDPRQGAARGSRRPGGGGRGAEGGGPAGRRGPTAGAQAPLSHSRIPGVPRTEDPQPASRLVEAPRDAASGRSRTCGCGAGRERASRADIGGVLS